MNTSDIHIATDDDERNDAFRVRIAVFVEEQGIPREEELDELDTSALHCVGYVDGEPVAAGRLVLAEGYGKIGRMAVLASHRGQGLGARVLAELEREAAAHDVRDLRLSAQLTARGFYDRLGYIAVGDVYDEVDIPHIAMEKRL
jgi:predicted GNAT family N-acyltransferase